MVSGYFNDSVPFVGYILPFVCLANGSGFPVFRQAGVFLGAQLAFLGRYSEPGDRKSWAVAQPIDRPIGAVRGRALFAVDLRRLGLGRRPHGPPGARGQEEK